MNLKTIKSLITRNVINIPGWHTKRKIVVIESDDWGSIRMPSKMVFNALQKKGFSVDQSDFNRLDSLESNDDMIALYEVLYNYKDIYNNHPIFTANSVVANPDFNKIKNSGFSNYYYEHVKETLKQYPRHDKVFDLWQEGKNNNIFYPQFHGREHLNITRWLSDLKKGSDDIMFCFNHNTTFSGNCDYSYMEAYDIDNNNDIKKHISTITDGLKIFEMTFGYPSRSFIAPCYTWSPEIEQILFQYGIKYIQGNYIQLVPNGGFNNYKYKFHFTGQKNSLMQRYLIRNCVFEPALNKKIDSVDYAINSIATSFRWNKPAIISSHRINYIGYIVEKNRTDNLVLLNSLLTNILKIWPDVEFISSDALGDLIAYGKITKAYA